MLEISVAASIEKDVPLEMDDLNWKEDGGSPETPSTVNDSWPWEHQSPSSSPTVPRRKSGNSAKIIAFAHEEFPLERPPMNCRMLYDTVPITTATTEQVERNEPIYDFSCRIIMSALSYSSVRHKSLKTARLDEDNHDDDQLHDDMLHVAPKMSLRSRLQPHAIIPIPHTTYSNSSSPASAHKSLHVQPSSSNSSSAPTGSKQQDHKYRSSISASFTFDSEIQDVKVHTGTTKTPHILSSLVSWLSSAGVHRTGKVAPNSSSISNIPSSKQTNGSNPTPGNVSNPSRSPNHHPDHHHRPVNVLLPTTSPPSNITTKQIIHINETSDTAATMHAVRAWASHSRELPTSSSPLITVPVRVITHS